MRFILLPYLLIFSFLSDAKVTIPLEDKIAFLFDIKPNESAEIDALKNIEKYCEYLRKYDNLSPKARVKKVFSDIKKKYLRTYYLHSFFPDLFQQKTYNCVTGTALIAIIFEELDIPISIVKVPNHVYLIAYPKSLKIGVESTKSKGGIYQWNDYSKKLAVGYLLLIGKTSENEIQLQGVDYILKKYFYVKKNLTFENLIGIHYFNYALFKSRINSNSDALKYAKLAYELDESEQTYYITAGILTDLIAELTDDAVEIIDHLTYYYQLENTKSRQEDIESHFEFCINNALQKRDDTLYINKSILFVKRNIFDNKKKNKFLSYIELERAEWLTDQGKTKSAYEHAMIGYELDNSNKRYEKLIAYLITNELFYDNFEIDDFDSILGAKLKQFPFLEDSYRFQSLQVWLYSYAIGELFYNDEEEQGLKYFEKIEDYSENSEFIDDNLTASALSYAYGEMAAFYFRDQRTELAIKWINKAVRLNPNSKSLQRKQAYIIANKDYYKNNSYKKIQELIDIFEDIEDDD
jgi:hypothetical protein